MTVDLPLVGTLCLTDRTCMDLHCISFQSTKKPPILVLRKGTAVQSNCWKIFLSLSIKYLKKNCFVFFLNSQSWFLPSGKPCFLYTFSFLFCVSQKGYFTSFPHRIREAIPREKCSFFWVILVNMEISVILGHEKTKICNIIDYGKIDVFSVRTNIHIKNKMMGHLI